MGEEIKKKKRSTTGNGTIVGLLSVWWYRFLILLPVYEDDQNLSNNLQRKHQQRLFDLCSPMEQRRHKGPHTIGLTRPSFSLFSIFSWFQMKMLILVAFFMQIIQKIQMKKKIEYFSKCWLCIKIFTQDANIALWKSVSLIVQVSWFLASSSHDAGAH